VARIEVDPHRSASGVVPDGPRAALPAVRRAPPDSIRPPRRWANGLFVAAGAGVLVWLSMARLTGSVTLFLSPDGGHYLTDADALLGDGVRTLAHPPAFPALVAATRGLVGPVGQVQVALGVSLWLLIVSLYVFCRQFAGVAASIAGAGVGATFPAIAELLAWNGGATLLATAFLVLTLAATERWLRMRSPWSALAVGLAAAGALLAHPFVAAVAFFCVAVRWVVELRARRTTDSLSLRGSPFSLAQLCLVVLPLALALPLVLPYYASVEADTGVRFGVPRLAGVWDTLTWGLREQGSLLLLFLVFLLAMIFGGRASASLAGSLGVVYLVVSSASRADPSYRTRVAYLLPIVGAVGVALLWRRYVPNMIARATVDPSRRLAVAVGVAIVVVMVFASLGYLPRIPRAAAFYQRLDPVDVVALGSLAGGHGLVATSWNQNAYGNGISDAWYVEGLAQRRAAGPTDPALSTLDREKVDGAAMQQFFSGEAGIENGALQLSIGPQSGINTPGLQAKIDGMYRPVLYVNDAVSGYPPPLGRSPKAQRDLAADATVTHSVTRTGITGRYLAGAGGPTQLAMRAHLDGRAVAFDYGPAAGDAALLSIRLFPGYGVLWRDVREDQHGLTFVSDPFSLTGVSTAGARGSRVTITPLGDTRVHYVERDPQFGLQSVELSGGAGHHARFRVHVESSAPVHRPRRFDQRSLIRRYGITNVVLWKDTGWKFRFGSGTCYAQTAETTRVLIYRVRPSCRATRPADGVSSGATG
jgi:hypothetical protein